MASLNENYLKLQAGYLFPEIERRVKNFTAQYPQADIIRLGIGDVTEPLPPSIVKAFGKAVREMGKPKTFRGYGPEQGYSFLREAIAENDFKSRGANIDPSEIFISDGAKCDTGNIQELFSSSAVIAVTDPVYPVYVDTNVMAGRTGAFNKETGRYDRIIYLPCTEQNQFCPPFPKERTDLIYICSPNNPTGTILSKDHLKAWVDYAKENQSVILFDAAYEAYITDPEIPHSIYEIEGAKDVAIEFRSFSKTAAFTGTRCAFTVVPKKLAGETSSGEKILLHNLWNRRHCTKFNGVSYPVQRAAEAVYTKSGRKEVKSMISYYLENASLIRNALTEKGFKVFGGVHAPYIWLQTPEKMPSWMFFDQLLDKAHVVGTPGAGFGPSGEGYFRLTAFGSRKNIREALKRIKEKI